MRQLADFELVLPDRTTVAGQTDDDGNIYLGRGSDQRLVGALRGGGVYSGWGGDEVQVGTVSDGLVLFGTGRDAAAVAEVDSNGNVLSLPERTLIATSSGATPAVAAATALLGHLLVPDTPTDKGAQHDLAAGLVAGALQAVSAAIARKFSEPPTPTTMNRKLSDPATPTVPPEPDPRAASERYPGIAPTVAVTLEKIRYLMGDRNVDDADAGLLFQYRNGYIDEGGLNEILRRQTQLHFLLERRIFVP